VFCALVDAPHDTDRTTFVLHRAERCYIVLNIYPYTTGHVLIVPDAHRERLADLPPGVLGEMTSLAVRVERALQRVYHPHGINLGMNLGAAAGAGIEEHLHLHVVPRWSGDTSFLTVTGRTRVMPEELSRTWSKLREELA
jgi:ATP adenylyltransferase